MNIEKLNALAAKVMGFTRDDAYGCWVRSDRPTMISYKDWNPCGDLNHANELIEKVTLGSVHEGYDMEARTPNGKRRFSVDCGGCWGNANTLSLAMTFCALRYADVPESSLTQE